MKFIEIFNQSDEKISLNVAHIVSFKSFQEGTQIKLIEGGGVWTAAKYEDVKGLVNN